MEEIARPEPGPSEVLVRVPAAAITRDELTWPGDRLPAIPSYELAGVVEASGEEVIALTPFDRDGVAADYAAVPETLLAPKPSGLSHEQAAALPMPALAAWEGLVVHGGLEAGERVLITGARGGVGHVAVQLVRALGGALVGEGEPCDLLFDTVGEKALARSADLAGRVVTIAAETPGAEYFVVEPNGAQLASMPELRPEVDSYSRWRIFAQRSSAWRRHVSVGGCPACSRLAGGSLGLGRASSRRLVCGVDASPMVIRVGVRRQIRRRGTRRLLWAFVALAALGVAPSSADASLHYHGSALLFPRLLGNGVAVNSVTHLGYVYSLGVGWQVHVVDMRTGTPTGVSINVAGAGRST